MGIEHTAGHLHISRVHARQLHKSCVCKFKYGVWINTFRHTFFVACCIHVLS